MNLKTKNYDNTQTIFRSTKDCLCVSITIETLNLNDMKEVNKNIELNDKDKKLHLSDIDISKIKELFENTISEYLQGVDYSVRSNYTVTEAICDALDESVEKLRNF